MTTATKVTKGHVRKAKAAHTKSLQNRPADDADAMISALIASLDDGSGEDDSPLGNNDGDGLDGDDIPV